MAAQQTIIQQQQQQINQLIQFSRQNQLPGRSDTKNHSLSTRDQQTSQEYQEIQETSYSTPECDPYEKQKDIDRNEQGSMLAEQVTVLR